MSEQGDDRAARGLRILEALRQGGPSSSEPGEHDEPVEPSGELRDDDPERSGEAAADPDAGLEPDSAPLPPAAPDPVTGVPAEATAREEPADVSERPGRDEDATVASPDSRPDEHAAPAPADAPTATGPTVPDRAEGDLPGTDALAGHLDPDKEPAEQGDDADGGPRDGPAGEASSLAAAATVHERPESPAHPLPRVLAIANQKGGVGKTTTSVNLGAALAELGYRVLVIDLDPQGNATTGLGIDIRNLEHTVYESLMNDTPLEDCIEATSVRNLFVAPSNMDLAGAEIELVPTFSRELKLRRAVEGVKDDYDYVLIDCPPSLGLLTVNGLAAADDVVVPIQCEYYALEGLGQLVNNVNLVRSNINPVLDIRGIILTMYDARTNLADQVVNEVRKHFGERVYSTVVPRTVRLSEAPSFGQPIIVFDSSSRGASAYRDLALEVTGRGLGDRTGPVDEQPVDEQPVDGQPADGDVSVAEASPEPT